MPEPTLHCWCGKREEIERLYGIDSDEWYETWLVGDATCMLPAGHSGPHVWTDDDKIGISFGNGGDRKGR